MLSKIKVYGRVQGIFFRKSVKELADKIGIKGSVRNCADGSVEIIAQGNEDKIKKLYSWIKSNPGFSKIERVTIDNLNENENYKDFIIIKDENYFQDKRKAFENLGKRIL